MEKRRMSDGQSAAAGEIKEAKERDHGMSPLEGLRASDIEPYTGLRYLSKLFRFMAVVLLLVLVAEIATGLYTQGAAAIPTLLGEASRLVVLAGVLWGTGDLAHLLIDVGHDVRASRILMARGAAGGVQFMPRDRATQARARREGGVIASDVPVADRSSMGTVSDRPADLKEPPIP
ncbi:MAG TPA: hypothetical protein VFO55_08845 [Gemmatimonadaceae bacterium]|nr:hypothetical protein [Gemmatimonadaceae bacterium]